MKNKDFLEDLCKNKFNIIILFMVFFIFFMFISCTSDKMTDIEIPKEEQSTSSEVDPNFHIYICFGQSNMEGNAPIEDIDKEDISENFQVLCATQDDELYNNRKMGEWYTAIPPLCRWYTGLSPVDYFGRRLIECMHFDVKVGVIVVALGGSGIDAFDKENYKMYYINANQTMKSMMDAYAGSPYDRIVELARKAQKKGIIKGILLHQGESNNMQVDWPNKVKKIYGDFMIDLHLSSDTVPLLVGEMLKKEEGGIYYGMNDIIATLPINIRNSHVISSVGCPGSNDNAHFTAEGYRMIGIRYADTMLTILKSYN